jgi:hypothetical protein
MECEWVWRVDLSLKAKRRRIEEGLRRTEEREKERKCRVSEWDTTEIICFVLFKFLFRWWDWDETKKGV